MNEDTIMEVREDFMVSPAGDSEPTFRTAHFLKPISNSIDEPPFDFNPSSTYSVFDPKEWPLKLHFSGWRIPPDKWVYWVDELRPIYESVWKKAGIFEAIMSSKCYMHKNRNLLHGVVEKWCCETNTFVFPFGEATITLEDVMVLGGYPVIGLPVFAKVEDKEMREVEKKLRLARQKPWQTSKAKATTTMWMDIFLDEGSEIEHEAFLVTWLSIFVFPYNNLVNQSLFPIAIHIARGNSIALAPAVLAGIYKDLTLFKKTIVDLWKHDVAGGDRFPLEVTFQSPFYLVQIWVWERFKNLQPQPVLINREDPLLFRWHKVQALKIDDVKLALDSAVDDFLWRPYGKYADKCGMFYPDDETWVPFSKELDKAMLAFAICLRVSELVGFDSIEQYLPHRVAMQFGVDQDIPSYVSRFNETKTVAWKNYRRLITDKKLYFPPKYFEADVTTRYARWWKESVLSHGDFIKKIVQKKRSPSSRKHRPCVGKLSRSFNEVGVPPGFPPNLVDFLNFGNFCYEPASENSTRECAKSDENIDGPFISAEHYQPDVLKEYKCGGIIHESDHLISQCSSASLGDSEKILPLKRTITNDILELSTDSLEEDFEDENGSKRFSIRKKVSSCNDETVAQHDHWFHSDTAAQAEAKETVEEKDDEVIVYLKAQNLKNQEELARLARQQEEILRLMALREKRDEELRQLLISVLRNQQPPPPSSS
ncbi:uncharacterized protein LOC131656750 [Vicia villosa]|uniref:uncharacterized protein LOC131656750 n=1 Tax=Vicia villosa TaxID=3911 RepID=UPI00273C3C97|nr:uncharacterized protein LOC131656750 [Vicia villosa]